MSDKYKNKYRIESNRRPGWDYGGNGRYFITIVSNDRISWFGEIPEEKMIYSDLGKIVMDEWHKSFEIRNELFLDEFILMPDHLHAIIILKKLGRMDGSGESGGLGGIGGSGELEESGGMGGSGESGESGNLGDLGNLGGSGGSGESGESVVQTHGRASQSGKSIFKRKPKSISSFIAGFKSATTNKIDDYIDLNNLNIPKFNRKNHLWQPNYHDHIIRNETEYYRIKNYIKNNPSNWNKDKFLGE